MAQAARLTRRIVGMLSARDADLQLNTVDDKRKAHLVKWPLHACLPAAQAWLGPNNSRSR